MVGECSDAISMQLRRDDLQFGRSDAVDVHDMSKTYTSAKKKVMKQCDRGSYPGITNADECAQENRCSIQPALLSEFV